MIDFGPPDLEGVTMPHEDVPGIRAIIINYKVARVFMDSGSSRNILFKETFDQI